VLHILLKLPNNLLGLITLDLNERSNLLLHCQTNLEQSLLGLLQFLGLLNLLPLGLIKLLEMT
jgi:hypothetical protein